MPLISVHADKSSKARGLAFGMWAAKAIVSGHICPDSPKPWLMADANKYRNLSMHCTMNMYNKQSLEQADNMTHTAQFD